MPPRKRRMTTAATRYSRGNPIYHSFFLNILNMRSVSRNPPMQLKEAVSIATITNTVISGERFLESRTKAPRIVIEEMALVALIKGVCNRVGTLETRKYPTPRMEKKIPSIMMRGNN